MKSSHELTGFQAWSAMCGAIAAVAVCVAALTDGAATAVNVAVAVTMLWVAPTLCALGAIALDARTARVEARRKQR